MKEFTTYCTKEQVKKALKLDAPIDVEHEYDEFGEIEGSSVIVPTAEQMIWWLRSLGFKFHFDDNDNYVSVTYAEFLVASTNTKPKEMVAIDHALDFLIQNKITTWK